ncbi:hypothetical protein ALC56_00533 [Trachymyrmex septentrionalis]|uniref:Uncharacterized protein n=1 Tax=Trachymyrmex septentrionalis TaxID=34720 RepID=A0A195FZ09_9HYME|nr:hypothetical protein ALC56_00533 [Trachymyrmex septentrionalis]
MRAAWREGQRDAPLCPVGCKRNLLSGYAVPAVLTVAKTKTATVAKQALSLVSRIDDEIREFRGGACSRNGNCTPEKKGGSQERKLERIFELEPPKRN